MHKSTKWSKKQLSMFFLVLAMGILLTLFFTIFVQAAASGTHEPITGVTVGVSGATDNSMSNGAVTVTAKGSGGFLGIGASSKTATITVTNSGSSTATVSFDWTATSVNQLVIDGNPYTGTSGSFSKLLDAEASFTITITTAKNSTTNKLVMSNFAWVEAKSSSNVTIEYDSNLGSVTAGGDVASGDTIEVSLADGAVLTATPQSGKTFVGWIDTADNKVISKTASFTCKPADDITIKAVFFDSNISACFWANEATYLFENLNSAIEYTDGVSSKVIVLAATGTLPSGNYTIPSGVTLLIPFDDANTLYTTTPGKTDASYSKPTAYRTLTMASGAVINVNGAMSLSAYQKAGGTLAGAPTGPVSFVRMENGSSIVINNGGSLYAWGYITGSGSVIANSGAKVYEDLQVANWRGGRATSGMLSNDQQVFPMSQYYLQNIEVPLTLHAGATEYAYLSVDVTLWGIQGSSAMMIGEGGMFDIDSGYLVKDYIEATDRLEITVGGNDPKTSAAIINMNKISVTISGAGTIDSSDYILPLNSNITVRIKNGSVFNVTKSVAMLPGSEVVVESGATCVIGSGSKIIVYDKDNWGNYVLQSAGIATLGYAPGRTLATARTIDSDAKFHIAGTVVAVDGALYCTEAGAMITGEEGGKIECVKGTETVTYQATQSGTDISYASISITPAKLLNTNYTEDGTLSMYTGTTTANGTYTYNAEHGRWMLGEHSVQETVTKEPTCTENGTKTSTCPCGYSNEETLTAPGHTPGEVVRENEVSPDCTTAGSYDEVVYCSVCKTFEMSTKLGIVIPATGHTQTPQKTYEQPATCTTTGIRAYWYCYDCECYFSDEAMTSKIENLETWKTGEGKIAAKGHTQTPTKTDEKPANCTEDGVKAYWYCSDCKCYFSNEAMTSKIENLETWKTGEGKISALSHNYGEWSVTNEPTVSASGLLTRTCAHDANHKETFILPVLSTDNGYDYSVVTEAECEVAGEGKYTYTKDGKNFDFNVEIAALTHSYVWKHDATQHWKECVCGDEQVNSRGNHSWTDGKCECGYGCKHGNLTWVKAVAPTCTVDGNVEYYHCEACQKNFIDAKCTTELKSVVDSKLNHAWSVSYSWSEDGKSCTATHTCANSDECKQTATGLVTSAVKTAPTCEDKGWTTYTATFENVEWATTQTKDVEDILAKNHAWSVSYSWSEDGKSCTATRTCSNDASHNVTATANITSAVKTAATCEGKGTTTYTATFENVEWATTQTKDVEDIPAKQHAWDNACDTTCNNSGCEETREITHTGGTATCKQQAVCDICDQAYGEYGEHNYGALNGEIPATCSKVGIKEHYQCSVCSSYFDAEKNSLESIVISKLPHTEGIKHENRVDPTCTEMGYWDVVEYCTVCNTEISRAKKQPIPMVAHTEGTPVEENRVESTCTVAGSYYSVVYCSVCKTHEISRTKVDLPLASHTPGMAVEENRVEAGCGTTGSYDQVTYCTVCGEESSRVPMVIPATGAHTYGESTIVDATCETDGQETKTCGECGHVETTVIPAKNHDYKAVVTNPTCTAQGYTTYVCQNDATHNYVDDYTPATGHTDDDGDNLCDTCGEAICVHVWDIQYDWEIDLSDLENPIVICRATGTCNAEDGGCGRTQTATANALGETIFVEENAQYPTCDEDGFATFYAVFADSWLKPEDGQKNDSKYVTIPKIGHEWVSVDAVDATCTTSGHTAYEYCSNANCGEMRGENEVIPALNHDYDSVVTDPTCSTKGYTTHTCQREGCGHSYVDTYLDATGEHVYSEQRYYDRKESWKECTGCKEKYDVVARKYKVTIVDIWGNETIREDYTYGQYLWLNYSTSNVLDLEYLGWRFTDGGEAIPAYEVWTKAPIDNTTTEFTVYEVSNVKGVKYGAIMMSVDYDKADSNKTMTVDLFIYVDSLADKHKPTVKLGEDELKLEKIDDSIMMWFVSIPLSAEQITQGGDNVKITVNYKDVPVKTINSVLIAYEQALDTYLKENVGDHAGEAQDEAINAVLDYGKTVQYVFGNLVNNGDVVYDTDEIAKYAAKAEGVIINNSPNESADKITFNWDNADVNFQSEYSIRYKFTLSTVPAGFSPVLDGGAQLIVRDSSGKVLYNYSGKTALDVGLDEEGNYYVAYPVLANDITKEGTTVQLKITLKNAADEIKYAESSEMNYGIYAYLTRQLWLHTKGEETFTDDKGNDKTHDYVNMLVSLIKLGESVNRIEAMKPNQQ